MGKEAENVDTTEIQLKVLSSTEKIRALYEEATAAVERIGAIGELTGSMPARICSGNGTLR